MCSGHYWGPREAQNIKIVVLRAYLHRTQLLLNKAQSNTVRPLATQVAAATALPPVGQANPSQATLIKPGEPNKTVPQVL